MKLKTTTIILTVLIGCAFLFSLPLKAEIKDMSKIFPSLEGFTPKGKPALYTPDNLFEYINGAADVFLAYDFRELASLSFENAKKQTFTVDVYRHSNDRNGYGIYSAEKPRKGPFMEIGAQGYYEKGILNFLRGTFYVKMSGYDLGDQDKEILSAYAKKLAANLEGTTGFPAAVKSFPSEGKVQFSESYIAKDFLGHSFLHSAFVADYEMNGKTVQVFVAETADPKGVQDMVKNYMAFAEKKGKSVEKINSLIRFEDPYYRRNGKMNMKLKGNYLWGLFCKDDAAAEKMIANIEANLKKEGAF